MLECWSDGARAVALCLLCLFVAAADVGVLECWSVEVDDALLDAVAIVESNGRNVPGDNGRAAGVYQLHTAACADNGAAHAEAWDRTRAREIARRHLESLNDRLAAALGRKPSIPGLYAAYNLGWDGFKRRGFRLARCPSSTRRAAAVVAALVRARDAAEFETRYQQLAANTERMLASQVP